MCNQRIHFGCECLPTRFWQKVRVTDTCWLWIGALTSRGQAQYWHNEKVRRASRVMLEMKLGPLLNDVVACHNCPGGDNPACVNPDHLYPRTLSASAEKTVANGKSKLNDDLVRFIRASALNSVVLSAKIGVTSSLIRQVRRGEIWTHVK